MLTSAHQKADYYEQKVATLTAELQQSFAARQVKEDIKSTESATLRGEVKEFMTIIETVLFPDKIMIN